MRKESVPVRIAAEILGISVLSVQGALREKALPIGTAWKNPDSNLWKYHISPYQLGRYIGMKKNEIYQIIDNFEK